MEKLSHKIKKLLTNPKDEIKLSYNQIKKYINNYKKLDVYNKNVDSPLQKIWIKLPKTKLLANLIYGDSVSFKIKVALAPLTGETNDIVKYINKIEDEIETKIKETHSSLTRKSSFVEETEYMSILSLNTQCKNNKLSFVCYNHNNQIIEPKKIEYGSLVSVYIELSEIWLNDSEFGFNWNILQIKTYPVFDFSKCLFDDEDVDEEFKPTPKIIPKYKNHNPPNIEHNIPAPISKPSTSSSINRLPMRMVMPSASMLKNMKNKLKKINSSSNNDKEDIKEEKVTEKVKEEKVTEKVKEEKVTEKVKEEKVEEFVKVIVKKKKKEKKSTSYLDKLEDELKSSYNKEKKQEENTNMIDMEDCLINVELEDYKINEDIKKVENQFNQVIKELSRQ